MLIEVIDSDSIDFPPHSEYNFSDFIVWLHEGMLPQHFIFIAYGKYWRARNYCVHHEDEHYDVAAFALYRERLGIADETETKGKVLAYIARHEDVRYHTMATQLNVSSACIGYHIADLKERGLVETDPLSLTEIGELALARFPL